MYSKASSSSLLHFMKAALQALYSSLILLSASFAMLQLFTSFVMPSNSSQHVQLFTCSSQILETFLNLCMILLHLNILSFSVWLTFSCLSQASRIVPLHWKRSDATMLALTPWVLLNVPAQRAPCFETRVLFPILAAKNRTFSSLAPLLLPLFTIKLILL